MIWRSSIASSAAAWVLEGARLISSPSTRLATSGPGDEAGNPVRAREHGAGQVGGDQIGGELDSGEPQPRDRRQRPSDERLGHTGHVLEEHVPVGQQTGQHQFEHRAFADHRTLDLVEDGGRLLGNRADVRA